MPANSKTRQQWPVLDDHEPLPEPYLPVPIPDVMLAFPANVIPLMPGLDVLEEVDRYDDDGWRDLLNGFMFSGVKETAKLMPVEIDGARIDGETCWRHLQALAGSYQPKHQHKEAAFVFLCKRWWEFAIWEDGAGNIHTAGEELDEEDKRALGF